MTVPDPESCGRGAFERRNRQPEVGVVCYVPMAKWVLVLPVALGVSAAALMSWEAHNSRIIDSMGMAWDTGAPVWPFQMPETLLFMLNAPAYVLAAPVFAVFGLGTSQEKAPILLVAIVLLWFCVGRLLDSGLVDRQWHARKRVLAACLPVALLSIYIAIRLAAEGAVWWSEYGRISLPSFVVLARITGPLPWCVAIASMVVRAIIRNLRPVA